MGLFKKIFNGIKDGLKKVPVVGSVVSAADSVYKAVKSSKSKPKTTSASASKAADKLKEDKSKRWFAWAPNWAIVTGGIVITAIIGWLAFGKKKRRR